MLGGMSGGQGARTATRATFRDGAVSVVSAGSSQLSMAGAKSATVVVGSSLIAHVVAGGRVPSAATLLLLFALAMAVCTAAIAALRQRRVGQGKTVMSRLAVGLAAAQLGLHAALGSGHHDHQGITVVPPPTQQPWSMPAGTTTDVLLMCLTHALAAVVASGLLAYGARLVSLMRAWVGTRLPWGSLTVFRALSTLMRPSPESWTQSCSAVGRLGKCVPRRGPPFIAARC